MKTVSVIRWIAYISGTLLFLFWGAFFLEHTIEWFVSPFLGHQQLPPVGIWIKQSFHLCMLLGFLIAFKYNLIGGLAIIGGAAAFFFSIGGGAGLHFFAITIIPALLYIYCWWSRRQSKRTKSGNPA